MNIALGREARPPKPAQPAWFARGLALIAFAAAVALVEPLALLFRLVSRTYNEGWNAFWADAALRGGTLYVSADSLIANNYPPLSFPLVGLIGRAVGDNIVAGRLVALASLVAVVLASFVWLRAQAVSRRVALAGALFLLTAFAWFGNDYIAMDDPQMLAHALMLGALVLLWRCDFSTPAVLGGAALMLTGGFVKHLLIPLPVATTVWIALYRRERLIAWLACFAIGIPLAFRIISHAYPRFLSELISARVYSIPQAISATTHALTRFTPLLLLGAVALVKQWRKRAGARRTPAATFVALYLVMALVIGTVASGGEGVTRNAFFDLLIASSLFAALGLQALAEPVDGQREHASPAASAVVMFFGTCMALYAGICVPKTLRAVQDASALEQDTRTAVALIQRLGHGRAACETPALCYWAHGAFTMDFFNYGQKLRTGAVPVAACERMFARGEFPVLQIEPQRSSEGRLWPCSPAIHRYYTEMFHSRIGSLLVPRPSVARR